MFSVYHVNNVVNKCTISVFRAFDKDMDSNLSQEEWVLGLSVFLRGTLEERVACKLNIEKRKRSFYIVHE